MAEHADKKPSVALAMPKVSIEGSVHAPILYFDDASTFAYLNGIVSITLEAGRMYSNSPDEGVTLERVAVAHLKMNVAATLSLKNALESALLVASPVTSEARN